MILFLKGLRDREVACSASDRQGANFESCVWRTVSSQSSHHPQGVLLAQFSLYVHKGGPKPDSFHFERFPSGTWFIWRLNAWPCIFIHGHMKGLDIFINMNRAESYDRFCPWVLGHNWVMWTFGSGILVTAESGGRLTLGSWSLGDRSSGYRHIC